MAQFCEGFFASHYGRCRLVSLGLTLGKFAPLHKGHQLLIETALAEVDHLLILVYECKGLGMPPVSVRAQWLRELYPAAEVLEAPDGPTCVGNTPAIMRTQEEYILRKLDGRRVTHFFSNEFYGEHVSRALGAVDRRVGAERLPGDISGTLIRSDAFSFRHMVHPRVYRDLITKAVFLGAPSTGKTTITGLMAKHFNTVWMPEYGREYWERHHVNRRLSEEQLVEIAQGHLEREEALISEANQVLFVDTNAITTAMFGQYYHGRIGQRLSQLATQAEQRYDLTFLCGDDIPYDDTWDRSGEVNRALFQQQITEDLELRGIPFIVLHGNCSTRATTVMTEVCEHLARLKIR